ncbi:hypothetical protein CSUI_006470 [Cystoisospora suis]|uniref:Uncharacterized protein n=1 Tax=Cystoisospora suis TaxID=483139 RepID=A0A2C6KU12_9APIC|nr:hypothetical protein CSUI_006470 [Cystoisospora suis]
MLPYWRVAWEWELSVPTERRAARPRPQATRGGEQGRGTLFSPGTFLELYMYFFFFLDLEHN